MAGIKSNKTLWAWGHNGKGQLGQNNTTQYSSPIQIPGTWTNVVWGGSFALAFRGDGTMWAWGENESGTLAGNLAHDAHRSSPVQIPGTTWDSSVGKSSPIKQGFGVLKTDGTLWMWGNNYWGQLGQSQGNNTGNVSSPVQVPGTTWRSFVGGGVVGAMATRTDGTLWSWGRNYYGALGHNNESYYSSPTQIPGTTWTDKVMFGYTETAAIKTDGTLWAWGNNNYGQLGQNDTNKRSSPVQIPGTTWAVAGLSRYSIFAVKTDGTLWSWGYGRYGALGIPSLGGAPTVFRSSPVQIPGTNWSTSISAIARNGTSVHAIKT